MRFYRILSDQNISGVWSLEGPVATMEKHVDPFELTSGKYFNAKAPLRYLISTPGTPKGLTFADFDVPIACPKIGRAFQAISALAVQLIPVEIQGRGGSIGEYSVVNVIDNVYCLDEAHSQIARWTEADGRTDKIGKYRTIAEMAIDSQRAAGHRIFRLAGWPIALIIDELGKKDLQTAGISGVEFVELAVY